MQKIIFSLLIISSFSFCQTIFAESKSLQVHAEVPLTKTWQEAIINNSHIDINQIRHDLQITVTVLGVQNVPVYNHRVTLVVYNDNGLLYQSKIQTSLTGKVELSLLNLPDGKYHIEATDTFNNASLRLNSQKNITLLATNQDLFTQILNNYLNWTDPITLSNRALISSISIPVNAKL